ncbi:reverse transcriptase RNA-dependent DNA polymerase [Nitzschia inconspicua]|nr:reverse transcriptase RNA-dependent DNA polymerase [Nitzschia inconspicua]
MSTKNPIDFQQYCRLLSAAAVQYEDYLTHEDDPWDPGDLTHEDDSWDPGDSFDIDTPVYRLEAKAHMSRPRNQRGPSMGSPSNRSSQRILIPKEVWHTLGDDFKVAWSNLSEEEKAMIFSTGLPSNNPRVVQLHERSQDADMEEESQDAVADSPVEPAQSNDQVQVHNAQQQSAPKFPPYDIRAILSSKGKQASTLQAKMCITSTPVVYRVSSTYVKSKQSLVDRGANGGIAGQDCKVICVSDRTVDVQGIDNHQLNLVSIGTAAGYAESNKGPVILILHQYALVGRGHSIHSPGQLEWFKHSVCDKSVHVGGLQWIKTADGHTIPIAMVHSLPRVRMRPPTDKEFDTLPHIMMTSDTTWGPAVLDFDREEEDDQWFDAIEHQEAHPYSELFDEYGNYRRCVTVQLWDTLCHPSSDPQEHLIDQCIVHANCERELFFFDAQSHSINETSPLVAPSTPRMSSNSTPDFEKLRPMFGWISIETIKRTFQHTTQLARTTTGTLLKKVYRSQNPALNVIQRGEPVATDVVSSDTPAVDCGATRCQVSVGMNTDVTNIYPFQTSKQFVHLLEDNVRFWGAPTKLEADCAPTDISGRVKIVSLTALPSVTVDTGVLLWYHLWQPVGHALTWKLLDAFMSKVLHQLLLRPTSDGALIIRLGTIGGEAPSYEGVVAVNHDGYYKAWLVADGHLIVDHLESVDYSVVSMRSFQIVMFLPELNGLEFWSRDIGNAHLESNPDRETHILLISRAPQGQRALYDLKLSGQGWYDELHDCLVALGLLPCRAEPDIWMRKNGELQVWKYVVLYAIQHPRVSIGSLTPKLFEFKLKGIGKIRHHLKLQFSQDEDRTLRLGQKKYPKKITEGYVCFFGSRPRRNACAPLERGDHPEMDISPFLDEEKTKMYQSLIGALQWIITIGWFNIFPTLITMSFIQDTPRYRHFKKITRNHSCLSVVV